LSFNALDLLDIVGPQAIAYEDETGSNFAIGIQNKEAFQKLIQKLETKDYATHTVHKGIHELKLKNPMFDLFNQFSNSDMTGTNQLENIMTQYGVMQPLFAEIFSATYGVRALDINYYLYWNEEQNWIVLNTLPYSLAERNKAKVSVAKWLEDQGIRSSGLILSYTGEIKGAEEAWYRDYVKFMRNNHDLLGQKFDPFSMPSPSSMKFNPTSRLGLHTAIDKEWVVLSLDYDISPFYAYSFWMGQGGFGVISVLSSFALPAYQDYTKRTDVSEGLALSTAAKLASTEYFTVTGKWPVDNEEAGLADAELITGESVDGISILENGQIYISYNYNVQYGGYLILQADPTETDAVNWYCFQTNLDAKVLPATCRDEVMFADETYEYDDSEYEVESEQDVELEDAVQAAEEATDAAQ
ncbi:MAG: pilin, partial [Wohlfahrtiimonas sp.]